MNSKIVRKLRNIARERTIGKPRESYLRNKDNGQIILNPNCEKAVYRKLKKEYQQNGMVTTAE